MVFPDLPHFDIPDSCKQPGRALSFEEYCEWVEDNIRRLQEQGLYDRFRAISSRTPVNARFVWKEADAPAEGACEPGSSP